MPSNDFLTKQDVKFVEEYIAHGNATKAAQEAYPTVKTYNSAAMKGSRNLKDVRIQDAIEDALLYQHHIQLFKAKKVDYFTFPKDMSDEDIVKHVNEVGIKVITVRTTDKSKMAFYAVPDAQAIKGALDLAYKIKGAYAPDKHINVNVDVDSSEAVIKATKYLNELYGGTSVQRNGETASVMGTEAQN